MKTVIAIMTLISLTTSSLNAQVPKKVVAAFSLKFKTAQRVTWAVDSDQYIAMFDHMEQSKIAYFKSDGQWIKTTVPIDVKDLKYCIKDHVYQEYGKAQITEAQFVGTPALNSYIIFISTMSADNDSENDVPDRLMLTFQEDCKLSATEKRGENK